jgi:hypothetical protein
MKDPLEPRPRPVHPYGWLWEPLEEDPGFVLRSMFGTRAAYLDGRLVLCFSAKTEPWRGLLVCTERLHQPSLRHQFPDLVPHPILPKWLYLPESVDRFEAVAQQLVRLARQRDPRLGIVPPRRRAAPRRTRRRP